MKVERRQLDGHPIDALVAMVDDLARGMHAGETLGFACRECAAMDEDACEIIHHDDCDLKGQTQPTAYDATETPPMAVTQELLADHAIEIVIEGETNPGRGLWQGEVLGFCCVECMNLDESVWQIIHEEDCALAGKTAPTGYADRPSGHDVATDGGRRD